MFPARPFSLLLESVVSSGSLCFFPGKALCIQRWSFKGSLPYQANAEVMILLLFQFCQPLSTATVHVADAKRASRVFCVKYSSDATYVYSGSDDTNIRLWKANASEQQGVVSCESSYPDYAGLNTYAGFEVLLHHACSCFLERNKSRLT